MHVTHSNPSNVQELIATINSDDCRAGHVVLHGGHFLLYHDSATRITYPCISNELPSKNLTRLGRDFGRFPELTWGLGLQILDSFPAGVRTSIMLIVNDWQHLPENVSRADFYARHSELPSSFKKRLQEYPEIRLLTPTPPQGSTALDTRPYFSETTLRNQFRKRLKKRVLPQVNAILASREELRSDTSEALRRRQAVATDLYRTSTPGDCATEIAELLSQLATVHHCDCFINIYPITCSASVEFGTELAGTLFDEIPEVVVNVGLRSMQVHSVEDLLQNAQIAKYRFPRQPP